MITLVLWRHPTIGDIQEPACDGHLAEIRSALFTLGIGCLATDQHQEFTCLRCQASPGNIPRTLLRQWFSRP